MKKPKAPVHVPKDALSRVHVGHSFAEYDLIRDDRDLFVLTPAIQAATQSDVTKCLFIGRRGTGKTAISFYVEANSKLCIRLVPGLISPLRSQIPLEEFRDPKHRPFKSLVSCFRRALYGLALEAWKSRDLLGVVGVPKALSKELNVPDHGDFDLHLLSLFQSTLGKLTSEAEKEWLKAMKQEKEVTDAMENYAKDGDFRITVLIDSIDESWDGTDEAVVYLMALIHTCVQLAARSKCIRPMLFLRENVFDRVREVDTEFAQIETWPISLEWSNLDLLEMIERRLNAKLRSKLPLRGPTWDHFFERFNESSSWSYVAEYCQRRPRDVLTFCGISIEIARERKQQTVTIEDMQDARKRFSDSRLKDLGDEYAENLPNISHVLNCFYGLGKTFTLNGLTAFISKLITDPDIREHCKWIYEHASPERFAALLYGIGFFGIDESGNLRFRGLGSGTASPPAITSSTRLVVHPTYEHALHLQDVVIDTLADDYELRQSGVLSEIPGAISLEEYYTQLTELSELLKILDTGREFDGQFEDIVGGIIRLCFFQWLGNVAEQVPTYDNIKRRDWIANNYASGGFWEAMRQRYHAVSVIWECKNKADLDASDFHQANYYIGSITGFIVIAYRGGREGKKRYMPHIREVVTKHSGNAMILLVNDQDLQTFIRQGLRGKHRDSHIRSIYDETVRSL